MDVLFHPTNSIDENFGYVPVEAMCCGVPVVGTAYGGLKDTILHGITGYTIPSWVTASGIRMDLVKAEAYLLQLLRNENERALMSKDAAAHARTNYSFDHCAGILFAAIENAIALRKQGRTEHVALKTIPPAKNSFSFLPATKNGWEDYINVVADYVSVKNWSLVTDNAIVRLSAPLIPLGNNVYCLDDAAWPASFKLEQEDMELLRLCEKTIAVSELLSFRKDAGTVIDRWIKEGLLIYSNT
jgi:hypothetical protein